MRLGGFGYKNAWFAVKGGEAGKMVRALAFEPGGLCEWSRGIDAAYESGSRQVFITPEIDGWTICVGTDLLDLADDNRFAELTGALAVTLQTEVHFFATHRVVEAHAWARATPEGLVRAYRFIGERGETATDVGAPTQEEQELGFRFFDERSAEAEDDEYWDREDRSFPTEENVMLLAGRWSLDPTLLEGRDIENSVGLLAKVPGSSEPASPVKPVTTKKPWWRFW